MPSCSDRPSALQSFWRPWLQLRACRLTSKPNILLIVADDMGYADVSFHGTDIKTPSIDSIATSGVKLEQFYAQPVCSPTRASLMTGRYPLRYGLQAGVVRPWALYGRAPRRKVSSASVEGSRLRETAICGKCASWSLCPRNISRWAAALITRYGHYNGALDYFICYLRDGGLDWHRDGKPLRVKKGTPLRSSAT